MSAGFVKNELPMPEELQGKLAESSEAMSALMSRGPESWTEGDVPYVVFFTYTTFWRGGGCG